ncbi:transcriptional regulator [Spirochaetia bacterium]|nr:transcriptional regulator [Spirochaetia bacterium]
MSNQLFNQDNCDCEVIHQDAVKRVKAKQPGEGQLLDLAELFKVFGDSTRIRIISALLHGELCVCDIAVLLGMTKSAISHQLRLLRQSKLVKCRRAGKVVFYSLDDNHVGAIFRAGLEHVNE